MNTVTSITSHHAAATGAARSIGDILVATGRLSTTDAARILERQQQGNLQFGVAAIALKVLTKEDIDFALSKQFDYAYLSAQDTSLSPELVAAYKPFSRVGENLRAVRSQLLLRWFNGDPLHKALAVVSTGTGDGRSFVAANLAIVFAQQGQRTLLIDGDLRATPGHGQHALFKLGKGAGLSGILADRAGLEAAQQVPGLSGLAVLPAGAVPPNPQELLGRPSFSQLLLTASDQFDVILIDTPNGSDFADAEIIASRAGAALMVARKNKSLVPQAALLARRLQDSGVALVGSVLNDA
ncbi:MAG: chain length determinant protein tyrosine kinase EpsG [Rhodoferax sp.]|uniref:chain length determinant protein tyrosine kinase EpsG n=1 Tax=Rhodoferax sp. TaxID=50421 RepID=UPI00272658C0|nr:chain length determinant protein tyrosine kinase EpsG [Rhodoferax sp.]MDO8450792.1 chain length determinant protein tyrosine kinase EpsG [Rhodoferax sp.]